MKKRQLNSTSESISEWCMREESVLLALPQHLLASISMKKVAFTTLIFWKDSFQTNICLVYRPIEALLPSSNDASQVSLITA